MQIPPVPSTASQIFLAAGKLKIDYFSGRIDTQFMDAKEVTSISMTDFKAHCTAHVRKVEKTGQPIVVTRHGKVVARLVAPEPEHVPTISEWIGSGAGLSKPGSAELFDEPTWQPGDWNMEREEEEL
jgi:prevent-host-death family protein